MDIIFIDTSIFESNNFLEGKRIKEVYKLAERKDIRVVLPQLIYDEIRNRILKNIDEAVPKFAKYREEMRTLRNVPSLSTKFDSFDIDKVKDELCSILKNRFIQSNFEIIDYPTLNIEVVFKNYFEKKFPFGSAGKKSEFPDAFALKSVEIWAEKHKTKVIAFSKDKDMLNYKSPHLEIIEDFDLFLSNKIKEIEGIKHKKQLEQIDNIINGKSENIQNEIKNWVEYQLDNYTQYNEYSDYHEVHDLTIIEVQTDIIGYTITNVTKDYISVELKISINYQVEIIIDDDNYMYKDDDTKEWICWETKPVLVDEIRNIDVDIIFDIDVDDDTVYEPEIESINKGKTLNI